MGGFSMVHWLIFGVVAVLLFGNRLPSVARSLGRSFVEFKKGMSELESEFNIVRLFGADDNARVSYTDHSEPAAPRLSRRSRTTRK